MKPPIKVEVIRAEMGFLMSLFATGFGIAVRTLIVWWAVAAWFPEYGLTYWQLVLPVCAARMLFGDGIELKRTFKPKSWALPKAPKAAV